MNYDSIDIRDFLNLKFLLSPIHVNYFRNIVEQGWSN